MNEAAGKTALDQLDRDWGRRYPGVVAAWRRAWEQFIPFLEFAPAIRTVIYTTNAIESINYQLRKITKTRGHFPDDDAAMKLLYLGIRNITGRHIDGEGRWRGERGTGTYGWKNALNDSPSASATGSPSNPPSTTTPSNNTRNRPKKYRRPTYTDNLT